MKDNKPSNKDESRKSKSGKATNGEATKVNLDQLSNPRFYLNRELSLLEFQRRVLAQAKDEELPLLERLRFLCIASSILDEFFEIRFAGLKQQEMYGTVVRGPDNLSPTEQLTRIRGVVPDLVEELYRVFNKELIPRLDIQNIRFLEVSDWNVKQSQWLRRYFKRELAPIMNPVGLDPAHPFPQPLNKSLTFIVTLEGNDAFGRQSGKAIVQAPRALPRVIQLPEGVAQGPHDFVLLSSVIQAEIAELFPGMKTLECHQFRVTRNSDLFVDEEEVDDLLRAVEGELSSRRYGDAVRLEVAGECPEELVSFLAAQFRLSPLEIYPCEGPVNLMRLATVPDLVDRPDLKFPGFAPGIPERIKRTEDMFKVIRDGDLLLHHPFQSFAPFVEFLRQAAKDPKVLSIRQTLYRTGTDSAVVQALVDAASSGKEVMVVIELRARFDEEANIELATTLQRVGAQVVYGVVGHKTHAKMSMVIRREGKSLHRYVHLGTGNYHTRTTRLYTDYGFFSCDEDIAEDVQQIFQQLTAMTKSVRLSKLLQSPFTLHKSMIELIEIEAENARKNKPARILAKMNSLIEPQVIRALYRASRAGVKVDLVVRGVCSLRPGIPGLSENIRVISVVGRFLEHTRVFCFLNRGSWKVYLSSADWMGRNFFNRVETCFPVEDKNLNHRILDECERYVDDNVQSWYLQTDGSYKRKQASAAKRRCAQEQLMMLLGDQT